MKQKQNTNEENIPQPSARYVFAPFGSDFVGIVMPQDLSMEIAERFNAFAYEHQRGTEINGRTYHVGWSGECPQRPRAIETAYDAIRTHPNAILKVQQGAVHVYDTTNRRT